MSDAAFIGSPALRGRLALYIALAVCELFLVSFTYKIGFDFSCYAEAPAALCRAGRDVLPALFMAIGGLALLAVARPGDRRALLTFAPESSATWWGLHAAGLLLVLVPRIWLVPGAGLQAVAFAGLTAFVGAALALTSGALTLSPARAWAEAFRTNRVALLVILGASILLPPLAREVSSAAWRLQAVTEGTFASVVFLLDLLGYAPTADAAEKILTIGDFSIRIGKPCSGMQGLALVTLFLGAFFVLFRDSLRFPAAFMLLPIGLLASLLLNVLRITALVALGVEVSPALAVGGFHSHAGWLLFTSLALGLALIGRQTFASAAKEYRPLPLLRDPVAAAIVPFAVFMATALLASTFLEEPELAYPFRAAALALAVAAFVPVYRAMAWHLDGVALAIGAAIGFAWVKSAPPADPATAGALAGLAPALLILWVICRVAGTVLLVPLVEELFFRGYLMTRLERSFGLFVGISASSIAFGLLHERWLIAAAAGVTFALLARRGGLGGAVQAHLGANAVVAAAAAASGQWHLI